MKSMQKVNCHTLIDTRQPAQTFFGTVTEAEEGVYLIDENVVSRKADGVNIELKVGDRVAYLKAGDESFIVSLLVAERRETVSFSFPFADRLLISAEQLQLIGRDSVSVQSHGELSFETAKTIRLHCQHLLQTAIGSVVSVMGVWVQKSEQSSIETKGVSRMNAGSHIMTAQEDLRLDAKRINMG